MSTTYENAVDALREAGGRLAHELPAKLPSVPSNIDWPDGLVERVTDDFSVGLDAVRGALGPAGAVAVGTGAKVAVAGGRTIRRHPMLYVGGGLVLVVMVAWILRRRRASSDEQHQPLASNYAASAPDSGA